jgi:hypothetical protein
MPLRPEGTLKRVAGSEIRLGEPLPFAVYDGSGMLLLQAGFVVNTPKQLKVLIENGCHYFTAE